MTSEKSEPLVTIVMPAWNRESTIGRAIESVLHQTFQDWQLIIIDDCSSDQTLRTAQNFAAQDKRISVLSNDKNRGSNHSRNRALIETGTEWYAFLDSDDFWRPDHLEKMLKRAESPDKKDSDLIIYSALLAHFPQDQTILFPAEESGDIRQTLARKSFIRTSCLMIHRQVKDTVGGFSTDAHGGDEYDLLIRSTEAGFTVLNVVDLTVDVYILKNRLHNKGRDFFRMYRLHGGFFRRYLTLKELGDRFDWTTNFARANGERFFPVYGYWMAFWHGRKTGTLLRCLSAPLYPEFKKIRSLLKKK